MTELAIALLREVAEAGGAVRLEGDRLRLSAPAPLPEELRARLRRHKAEIVALLADEATDEVVDPVAAPTGQGPAAAVADGVAAILAADGATGVPPHYWPRVQRDTARLADGGWLDRALALGWTPADLFGCDVRAPWHRLDRAGLVLLLGGHEITGLDAGAATLRTATGSVQRYRRRPPASPPVSLLWQLLVPARATGPPSRGPTPSPNEERMAATFLAGPRRHPDHDHPLGE
jgi:hypothetical protein